MMEESAIVEKLTALIQPILEEDGFELVELKFARSRYNSTLTLLVDRQGGGIDVEDCTAINRKVGEFLDAQDIIREKYLLEVSSPGIDRLLKTKNDFLRSEGKDVKFFLREAINGRIEFDGKVCQADEQTVKIETKQGMVDIPLSSINKAKQIF